MRKLMLRVGFLGCFGFLGCWSSSPPPASSPKPATEGASTGGETYGGEQYAKLVGVMDATVQGGAFASLSDPADGSQNSMGSGIGDGTGTGTGTGYGVRGAQDAGQVPAVKVGDPSAQDGLDKAIIRRYIKRNVQKIQYCYEKELISNPQLAGTVTVRFTIGTDGAVSQSTGHGMPRWTRAWRT